MLDVQSMRIGAIRLELLERSLMQDLAVLTQRDDVIGVTQATD
jgi:hypothetical protein